MHEERYIGNAALHEISPPAKADIEDGLLIVEGLLNTISANIRDAEFKNLLADLNIELADVKMKLAEVVDENARLKQKVRELEHAEGEPCPKYRCSACDLSEEKLVEPK